MKIVDIDRIFNKLSLQVRLTGHNYGWLTVNDKKILRVHYSHGKGDLPNKIMHKIRGQLKLSEKDVTVHRGQGSGARDRGSGSGILLDSFLSLLAFPNPWPLISDPWPP